MAKCRLCGGKVLPPRRTHAKCRRANEAARVEVAGLADRWLAGEIGAEAAHSEIERLERDGFLGRGQRGEALRSRFEKMTREALDDAVLTVEEESQLGEFAELFGLGREELDQNGWYTRYLQSAALRDLLHGRLPQSVLPMELEPGETLLWLFPTAQLTEGASRQRGVSLGEAATVRVSDGLYFRMADLRRSGGETDVQKPVDVGPLGVTNRYAHFAGKRSRFRIRLEDLERLEPTAKGVVFRRPGRSGNFEGFETGDGWFLVNLLTNARNAGGA